MRYYVEVTSELNQQGLQDVFNAITGLTPWIHNAIVMFNADELKKSAVNRLSDATSVTDVTVEQDESEPGEAHSIQVVAMEPSACSVGGG